MAKDSAGKTTTKKKAVKKTAKKKAAAKKKHVPFERKYKLIICRKQLATGVMEYWMWGNRWSSRRDDAHRFDRDFDASLKMVEHLISHGKVIEDRDA